MRAQPFFYHQTDGIRVTVRPVFLPEESEPALHRHVFAYFIRIENVGPEPARLLRRRWFIRDAIGENTEIEGDGVVGEQPRIESGRVHEYHSFCVLKAPTGSMEGHYLFTRDDGSNFTALIPRFQLDAAASSAGPPN